MAEQRPGHVQGRTTHHRPRRVSVAKIVQPPVREPCSGPHTLPDALDADEMAGADAPGAIRRGVRPPRRGKDEWARLRGTRFGEARQIGEQVQRRCPEAHHLRAGLRRGQPQAAPLEIDK